MGPAGEAGFVAPESVDVILPVGFTSATVSAAPLDSSKVGPVGAQGIRGPVDPRVPDGLAGMRGLEAPGSVGPTGPKGPQGVAIF
ncbi:hypothetical protein [Rana esculenta virus]|uniref:Collagen-like protein n=1 Tax=Rana esculenta virus TaxID=575980 RepID=A0A222NTY4_9VIRU|nr:hypothetical protein [Rana esculenta virus]